MKRVLIKISGELFTSEQQTSLPIDKGTTDKLAQQIKELSTDHKIGIVLGAGNFFRGGQHGAALHLSRCRSDQVGMLGTIMNGLMLQEILAQHNVSSAVSSAFLIPGVVDNHTLAQQDALFDSHHAVIFVGGTGNPLFSTDTCAVIRAVQMEANELWKATKVDYAYSKDPKKYTDAKPLYHVSYQEAFTCNLGVMDRTALCLGQEHNLDIRIFNLFADNALINVAQNAQAGSRISNSYNNDTNH